MSLLQMYVLCSLYIYLEVSKRLVLTMYLLNGFEYEVIVLVTQCVIPI